MIVLSVLAGEFSSALTGRRALTWHAVLAFLGPLLLLLFWPSMGPDHYLERGAGPGTLTAVAMACAAAVAGLSGAFTLDRMTPGFVHPFLHWLRYTPARSGSYLAGRVLYHLLHSVLLSALIAPSLVTAAAASRARPGEALLAAAFIAWISFCLRCAAEAGRSSTRPTSPLVLQSYLLILIALLLFSRSLVPDWCPALALQNLTEPALEIGRGPVKSAAALAVFALGGTGLAAWRLRRAARVERAA